MSPITLTPTTSENLPLLREFAKFLDITSIIQDFIRSVIFAIYHGLYVLAKGARSVFEAILGFLDFTESTQLNELFQAYKPLIWVLMILSLMFVGYLIMFNKLQHRENVVTNIIILLVMMTILPMAITQFNSFVRTFLDDANQTQAEQQSATVVDDIFLSSIVDVELLARSGWPPIDEDLRLNQLTVDSLETFDINTRITDTSIHTALDEKLVYDQVTKMERSKLLPEILKEYYYRFSVNYWRGIFGLGVLAFVYIIYAIITARLILELAINKILALLISASDLHSGQRMKGAIIEIIKAYLTIIGMIFMTVIFGHFVNWLYHSPLAQANRLAMAILLIGSAFAMVDGAKIFERILGVDVGVRGGNRALLTTLAGGSMLIGMGKKAVNLGAKGFSKMSGASRVSEGADSLSQEGSGSDEGRTMPTAMYQDPINPSKPNESRQAPSPENDTGSMRTPTRKQVTTDPFTEAGVNGGSGVSGEKSQSSNPSASPTVSSKNKPLPDPLKDDSSSSYQATPSTQPHRAKSSPLTSAEPSTPWPDEKDHSNVSSGDLPVNPARSTAEYGIDQGRFTWPSEQLEPVRQERRGQNDLPMNQRQTEANANTEKAGRDSDYDDPLLRDQKGEEHVRNQ